MLAEVVEEVRGSADLSDDQIYELWSVPSFADGRPELLKGEEIRSAKRPVQPDDVLLCKINPRINRVWVVAEQGVAPQVASTEWIVLRLKSTKSVTSHWLQLYLSSPTFREWIVSEISGATGSHTRAKPKEVMRQRVPLPPLPEQKRIVAILDEAFAGIATAVANTEKNLTNARELFESYLHDLVDRAFSRYGATALADVAEEITDGDHMPPPKAPSGVPFITIRNIDKGTRRIDFDNTFRVPRSYFEGLRSNKRPRTGDVLYTVTGSFGVPVLVGERTEFCFQRHIGLIRPRPGTDSRWLYYVLMSPQILAQATDGATGTAQKTVSLKVLRNFQVPSIPSIQQVENVQHLDSLLADVERLESIYKKQLRNLGELRQSLLQKAFSGELTAGKAASEPVRKVEEIA